VPEEITDWVVIDELEKFVWLFVFTAASAGSNAAAQSSARTQRGNQKEETGVFMSGEISDSLPPTARPAKSSATAIVHPAR
jgi:hypothetical protein